MRQPYDRNTLWILIALLHRGCRLKLLDLDRAFKALLVFGGIDLNGITDREVAYLVTECR